MGKLKPSILVFLFISFFAATFYVQPLGQADGLLNELPVPTVESAKVLDLSSLKEILTKELGAYQGEVAMSVTDLKSGKRIDINGDTDFFPASSIKALLLVKVLQDLQNEKYSLQSVDPFLTSMANVSSNYAANSLMLKTGVQSLSQFPNTLGLSKTVFIHGFSDGNSDVPRARVGANNITSSDANLFWQKLYNRKILNEEMTKKAYEYLKLPTVKLIYTPEGIPAYHKPGYIGIQSAETYIDSGIVETETFAYVISYFSRKNPTHQAGADFGWRITQLVYDWFSEKSQ